MKIIRVIFKLIAILVSINLFIAICFIIIFYSLLGPAYNKDDLIDNYLKRQNEILELKTYFNGIVPENKCVEIEFKNNRELERFGTYSIDSNKTDFLDWNMDINSKKMDSILANLGWNRNTLKTVKSKLDKANCIKVVSGEPAETGFKRSLMAMFEYQVYKNPIPDSLRKQLLNCCELRIYNDKLVLEYSCGAVGNCCFPD